MNWFQANGLRAVRQDVEFDRPNAVGIVKGDGTGLSLGFNGHTDTSFTGTEEDRRMVAVIEPQSELTGKIVGNKVQGLGISIMKGGVAAFMMAGKALHKSGVKLKGDVILAALVGEISRTPVGPWQTKEYRGEGAGTRHLLTHGMHSDYAVCCDGSDMNIVWTQNGVVQVKIQTTGKAEAAWGTNRETHPMTKMNAIVKMTKIIDAIEKLGAEFEAKYVDQSPTGPLYPKVNIGGIEGGAPYRPGTDDQGRDVLARLIYGFRISVLVGLVLTLLSSAIGVIAGAFQGYFGGWTDLLFQRFIEIWSGLPELYLLIILASVVTPTFGILVGLLLLFSWTGLVGVVRAEFLRARNFDYVRAAKALGARDSAIMFRHVLPNAMVATLTFMPFVLSGSVVALTSLDFLGFGLPVGSPSLGELLAQGNANLQAPWLGITSFFVIAIMLSLLVFIGEAVRDAFDPRRIFR